MADVQSPQGIPFPLLSSTGELANARQINTRDSVFSGGMTGTDHVENALVRVDLTGLAADPTRVTTNFTAAAANINQWRNREVTVAPAANGAATYTAPSNADIESTLTALQAAGMPQRFSTRVIFDGGDSDDVTTNRLTVVFTGERVAGRSAITLTRGQFIELLWDNANRSGGNVVPSIYLESSVRAHVQTPLGSIQIQEESWDASNTGNLPTSPQRGYAYLVANAGDDGSTVFGVFVRNRDLVVYNSDTFTDWSVTANWFVLSSADQAFQSNLDAEFSQHITRTDTQKIRRINNIDIATNEIHLWGRTALVTQAGIDTSETGLRLDEANRQSNGTFDRTAGTLTLAADTANLLVYVSIATVDEPTDLATWYLIATTASGEVILDLPLTDLIDDNTLTVLNRNIFRTTTQQYNFHAGETLSIVRRVTTTQRTFGYDPVFGDFTSTIKNLPLTALGTIAQNAIQAANLPTVTSLDRAKLTAITQTTTQATSQTLTGSYMTGEPSELEADYNQALSAAGILGRFAGPQVVSILIDDSTTDIAVSNGATLTTTTPDGQTYPLRWVPGKKIYRIEIPTDTSTGAATAHVITGTTNTHVISGLADTIKIDEANVETAFLDQILNTNHPQPTDLSAGLADLNSHITVAGISGANWQDAVNRPNLRNATYSRTFAMLWDENQRANPGNYFTDLADPTITIPAQQNIHFFSDVNDARNRFPGKQSWVDSTVRVNGLPLTDTFTKVWGFSALIPETFTGNIVLFQAGPDSAQRLLRVAMVDGVPRLQARRGNLDGASQNHAINRFLQVYNTDSVNAHWVGNAVNSTDFELKASDPVQSYLFQVRRYENGAFTGGESFTQSITDRTVDVGATVSSLFSGELSVTHSYDAASSIGFPDTVDAIRISTNNPGNANISYIVDAVYSVTEAVQDSSTSAFQTINNVSVGTEIDLVFILEKENGLNTNANAPLQLKINVNGISDNDFVINLGADDFDFSDVRFGDTADCLISNIQIYDFVAPTPFDFPTHSLLNTFYQRRNEWFGLFRNPAFDSRTYTINGELALIDRSGGNQNVTALLKTITTPRTWRDSGSFTSAASVTVDLPTDSQLDDFIFISVEWHTGTTDASANDNANRRFAQIGATVDIYDASGPNVIIGAGGRGADSFGVRITAGNNEDTSVTLEVINLNTQGGATLPTGTAISKVRFY